MTKTPSKTSPQHARMIEQIRALVVGLIDRGRAPSPTNAILPGLRFFYRDVLDRPDVLRGLRNRKRPRRLPRHMIEAEVERLLLETPDVRYRTATLLTYADEKVEVVIFLSERSIEPM